MPDKKLQQYRIYIERDINWRWVLKMSGGRILCTSPAFDTREEALENLKVLSNSVTKYYEQEMAIK